MKPLESEPCVLYTPCNNRNPKPCAIELREKWDSDAAKKTSKESKTAT